MAKKNREPKYPADVKQMLDPVVQALRVLIRKGKVGGIANPYPFAPPVHHAADPALPIRDEDDAVERLVVVAFQYGMCQGYAVRNEELQDAKPIYDSLATIIFRG